MDEIELSSDQFTLAGCFIKVEEITTQLYGVCARSHDPYYDKINIKSPFFKFWVAEAL